MYISVPIAEKWINIVYSPTTKYEFEQTTGDSSVPCDSIALGRDDLTPETLV